MKRRSDKQGGRNNTPLKNPQRGEKPINAEDIKTAGLLWSAEIFTPKWKQIARYINVAQDQFLADAIKYLMRHNRRMVADGGQSEGESCPCGKNVFCVVRLNLHS